MTLKIGLTGGIGAGKSVVARIFEVIGVPVYYADDAARELQNNDPDLISEITALFGPSAYQNGKLDRKYISEIVFNDAGKLRQLNALVHPITIQNAFEWMKGQTAAYSIKEAALIFESGAELELDYVIGVTAPEKMRISRTMARDSITEEEVRRRMERQIPEDEKMRLCDYVIFNDEKQLLIPQVLKIHNQLLTLSEDN